MADALDRRLVTDDRNVLEPFTLMAHKPDYILLASHNFSGVNEAPFREQYDDPTLEADDTEAKFQISLKIPLLVNLFEKKVDIYAAYTNRSFWQLCNNNSAPFRETNHEPEIWLQSRHSVLEIKSPLWASCINPTAAAVHCPQAGTGFMQISLLTAAIGPSVSNRGYGSTSPVTMTTIRT